MNDANVKTTALLETAKESKFDFQSVGVSAAADERLKTALNVALVQQQKGRELRLLELPDSNKLRTLAGDIKQHALDYLDYYLEQLQANVEKNGGHVHSLCRGWALTRNIT